MKRNMSSGLETPSFILSIIALLITCYVVADTTKIRKNMTEEKKNLQQNAIEEITKKMTHLSISMIHTQKMSKYYQSDETFKELSIKNDCIFLEVHFKELESSWRLHKNDLSSEQIEKMTNIMNGLNVLSIGPVSNNIRHFLEKELSDKMLNPMLEFIEKFSIDSVNQEGVKNAIN